ncbi:MAG: molecular chaperone DjlA [Flavobacteriaceae bacterium CG_4_8_14_3_um_filter_34_10]|nr:molecular chaperone DjiA [Flavobacteriia bacterium]OIP49543.1 MAG: molecular chaperone DjlA [Flavobacteriaceae bacterium CG2_30_34_30]PIQ19253.1 MAG: molecular chaperone DjlA [Flavobacteriaceae bacterium CG18_big_fil_WC_8_21_14_2_50_34_36]PIV48456.1 MAG: molecular chaperone DjlA [Flavobacteriaceae bacterium CG02_land_8_20_14_3_00_34_13]PIX09887.1 MAG: molecular chaperone DjlA [Flavobacteriaceae bacterium CG_4_8_14_3_um_filter_34_10]PIZ08886.1 MAG: molecular chaperone DjlA [Flavobacteriaceae
MIRWIAAIAGYIFFRFPGAIIGFILGSVIEGLGKKTRVSNSSGGQQVTPADFELNLLSLASMVIKSDGNVSAAEMQFVQNYFVQAYGKERANATFRTFNEAVKNREVTTQPICEYLRMRTRYESRLQIIHFLFNIAQADGLVSQPEVEKIREIAGFLAIGYRDFESIKAMFFKNPDSAYRILEIEKTATPSEIKAAYRTMAKKYHPDKLQHMDEAYRKGAEDKFRKVQEAYEHLQKEKGF